MIEGAGKHKAVCAVAAAMLVVHVSGCSTSSEIEPAQMTLDERQLREQSDSFVVESAGGGAIVLGTIGCILGATLVAFGGGDVGDVGRACAVAGAIGAVAGGVDGYMNAKEAQYKTNETAKMRSMAEDVRADNEKLRTLLESTRRVTENDQKRLDALKAEVDARTMTLEQAESEAAIVRANSEQIEEILNDVKDKRDLYLEAREQLRTNNTAELDKEIQRLNQDIAELEGHLGTVNASLQLTGLG